MISGTKAGDKLFLEYMLGNAAPGAFVVRLFQNNYTPTYDDVPSDYTEATLAGYAAVTLSAGTWVYTAADPYSHADYPQITWTFTGSGSLYGYYITDTANTTVFIAEVFGGGPFTYPSAGGLLLLSPRIGLL